MSVPGLPWRFEPEQNSIEVRLGEVVTVNYRVINQAARPITASAAYNVTPLNAGAYFQKINCFCFTEQSLKAGETRDMAVVFYVDPAMAKDPDGDDAQHHHAVLHVLSATRAVRGRWRTARPSAGDGRDRAIRSRLTETEMADAHAKPHHDYHLVDPSPWPAVGSISAFVMAVGAITWMHHMFAAAPLVFGAGVIGVLYTFSPGGATSSTRRSTGLSHPRGADFAPLRHDPVHRLRGDVLRRLVLGLFRRRAVPRRPASGRARRTARLAAAGRRPSFRGTFDPWHLPLLNTLILLTSGTTVTWAHHALLHGDRKGLINGLWLTIILGATFTCVQAYEYYHAAFNYSGHIYGATFFMATGFHGAHVLIGTTFLIVCLIRAYKGHFTPTHHLGFEFCAWYWHFVDVVWLFLFACIYVWGAARDAAAPH